MDESAGFRRLYEEKLGRGLSPDQGSLHPNSHPTPGGRGEVQPGAGAGITLDSLLQYSLITPPHVWVGNRRSRNGGLFFYHGGIFVVFFLHLEKIGSPKSICHPNPSNLAAACSLPARPNSHACRWGSRRPLTPDDEAFVNQLSVRQVPQPP